MKKVIRHMIADYLDVSTNGTANYALLGTGVTSLDENPSAKIEKTAYINDRSVSGTITGYETTFPFNTQFIADDDAIKKIYDISRNQETGGDAECDYVRVDLYADEVSGGYPARKFRVAVEVSSVSGAGTEIMTVSGNLHQVGNFVEGTFNPATKTFTASGT